MKPANFPTKPGYYIVSGGPILAWIELDDDGKVYQLNYHSFERDVELDDEGWNPESKMEFKGPFERL